MIQNVAVTGMTCQNCVRHVREALAELPGVASVEVDLASGTARLQTRSEVPRERLAAALEDAGYNLA